MKSIKDYIVYYAILLFLLTKFDFYYQNIFLCVFIILWLYKTKDTSCIWIILLSFLFLYSFYKDIEPPYKEGRVIQINENYIVLQKGQYRWLGYTDEEVLLDSTVKVKGSFTEITKNKGFYRFDFQKYCQDKGIYYSQQIQSLEIIKQPYTIRGLLYKQIHSIQDETLSTILKRILFNQKDEDLELKSFLHHRGFSYVALLHSLETLLKKRYLKDKRKHFLFIINLFLCILFHFPYVLAQSLFMRIFDQSYQKLHKTSFFIIFTILFYRHELQSMLFYFLIIIRLFRNQMNQPMKRIQILSMMQSFFFYEMNPVLSLFYPYILRFNCILYGLSLISILFPNTLFIKLFQFYDSILSMFNIITLPGTILGIGLIFYGLLYILFYKFKYKQIVMVVFLFLFQYFGLFHPLGEVSYINVGQGDAILIRMPINQENILIDTGKPSAYTTLNTYLKAKGIKRIDYLVITHMDSDHSGNLDTILKEYDVRNLITEHTSNQIGNHTKLIDLNTISNEDANQSSIVLYTEINHLKYLFMGDADEVSEKGIIDLFPILKCDILKASHHGSKTGSSESFLDVIQPKIGIFSCGRYSLYHHPSPETIQRFLQRHISYYSTYEEGDISIFPLFNLNLLRTSTGKINFIIET